MGFPGQDILWRCCYLALVPGSQWFVTQMKNTWNWIEAPELRQLEEGHLGVGKKWLPFCLPKDEASPLKQQCLKWSFHSIPTAPEVLSAGL